MSSEDSRVSEIVLELAGLTISVRQNTPSTGHLTCLPLLHQLLTAKFGLLLGAHEFWLLPHLPPCCR